MTRNSWCYWWGFSENIDTDDNKQQHQALNISICPHSQFQNEDQSGILLWLSKARVMLFWLSSALMFKVSSFPAHLITFARLMRFIPAIRPKHQSVSVKEAFSGWQAWEAKNLRRRWIGILARAADSQKACHYLFKSSAHCSGDHNKIAICKT